MSTDIDDFLPLDHSVYLGRERLGRYLQTAPRRFAAFDARDRLLGDFKKQRDACAAIAASRRGGRDVG
ncbi:hypothetical protein [Tardiphaga sp. vice278]|uniref:hypothetical protein n=1 Tax=Tardiphaga sp. vice278 TaxID=2592815 RepID=UPI00143CF450|nr:hypothetical protein [Tardiphaga sp. vice278]